MIRSCRHVRVAPAHPRYQLGSGDALQVIDRDDGLSFLLGGPVGSVQRVYASTSNIPSTNTYVDLALGNQYTQLVLGGQFVIPAAGWLRVNVPPAALFDPGPSGLVLYSQTFALHFPAPFEVGELQSMQLVR